MKVFISFLCLMVGGSTAFFSNDKACDGSPIEDLTRLEFKPNRTELLRLCQPTLDFFECYFRYYKTSTGMDIAEIAESGDGIASRIADTLLNARNLAVEMCDDHSPLHNDYLENIDCFERYINEDSPICTQKGELHGVAFLRYWHNLTASENVDWEELDCLERVYQLACFAEQIETTCGEVARRTYLTIVERVKNSMFAECNVETPLSLKRTFFEYLKLDGKRSELYRYIFETFRRR